MRRLKVNHFRFIQVGAFEHEPHLFQENMGLNPFYQIDIDDAIINSSVRKQMESSPNELTTTHAAHMKLVRNDFIACLEGKLRRDK